MEEIGGGVGEEWAVTAEAQTWGQRIPRAKGDVCQVPQESSVPPPHPVRVRCLRPSPFPRRSRAGRGLRFLLCTLADILCFALCFLFLASVLVQRSLANRAGHW